MWKQRIITAALFSALTLGLVPAAALADTSIGTVDTARVLNEYHGVSTAERQFKAKVDKLKKAWEDRARKLQEARQKNVPKAKLDQMEQKFTQEIQPLKAEVDALNKQLTAQLRKQLDAAVDKVAVKKNITVVFDKQAILHGGIDLTDDVLQILNGK